MQNDLNLEHWMAKAIELSKQGSVFTRPNPLVGAIIVKDKKKSAQGYHAFLGGPHAETAAINNFKESPENATLFVSLEPCCHFGRTAPCVDIIKASGIKNVVIAVVDPNPQVNGKGIAALKKSGINIVTGVLEQQARAVNKGYFCKIEQQKPYVRLKMAASIDGKVALANGNSQWISSEQSRQDVHKLRALSGAIITGAGTVLKDDPSLTARLPELENETLNFVQPMRVVLDPQNEISSVAKVFNSGGKSIWVQGCNAKTSNKKNIESISTETNLQENFSCDNSVIKYFSLKETNQVDLHEVLNFLAKQDINDVLIEAGPALTGSFIKQNLVDELVIYVAPKIFGFSAKSMFNFPELKQLEQAYQFKLHNVSIIGDDVKLVYTRET